MGKFTSSHPWHDLPLGEDVPNICNAVIEIPRGVQLALMSPSKAMIVHICTATAWALQVQKSSMSLIRKRECFS
jgi:hypothetical protein